MNQPMRTRRFTFRLIVKPLLAVAVVALTTACSSGGSDGAPGTTTPSIPQLGDPNPGLTIEQRQSFERGREIFEHRFERTEGHGPDFNTSSCASCHATPVTGGSSALYRNFMIVAKTNGGEMDVVFDDDQIVARNFSYTRVSREAIPADADIRAQRNSPPMFGLGMLERIDDFDVAANHDPDDDDNDGISGRVNLKGGALGRFGLKAQESDLVSFLRGPLFNHMGITTEPLRASAANPGFVAIAQVGSGSDATTDSDGVPDPEMSNADLVDLLAFVRELAPPVPLEMDESATRGELLFDSVGCAKCHIKSVVRVGEPINAYTDMLLHDMGAGLADGVMQELATASEFRTSPLWGVRHHAPYMHDGRSDTLADAIDAHGGEAQTSANNFDALLEQEKTDLIRFLETR